jgi:hypothetical protein
MSAFKRDLQRVLADQGYVLYSQLVVWKAADAAQPAWSSRLTAALRAWTRPPQRVGGIGAVMPAFPLDLHHLARAVDVDVDRKRIRVFQWTLMTGSWRNDWIDVRAAT